MKNKFLEAYLSSERDTYVLHTLRQAIQSNPELEDDLVVSTFRYFVDEHKRLSEMVMDAHLRLPQRPIIMTREDHEQRTKNRIIKLFVINNGKTKQFGIERLCHNFDWRIDLYFWSWTIFLEEVEE